MDKLLPAFALVIAIFAAAPATAQMKKDAFKAYPEASAETLRANMRTVMETQVFWTRNVILCIVDDLPGTDQAIRRLLENQVNIGNIFKPYYGEVAGNKITELFKEHVNLSIRVFKASKTKIDDAPESINEKWFAKADEIAAFLNKTNPNLVLADMKTMLNFHLQLTADEVDQRNKRDYDADIIAFDNVHNEILKLSDVLSNGIIRHFPEKFKIRPATK